MTMDPFVIAETGLLLPGHDLPPAAAVDTAAQWLRDRGASEWDVFEAVPDMRPARAWWGGAKLGFVDPSYEAAAAVTVVHLPLALIDIAGG